MRKISMGLAALGVAASMTLAGCAGATPSAASPMEIFRICFSFVGCCGRSFG